MKKLKDPLLNLAMHGFLGGLLGLIAGLVLGLLAYYLGLGLEGVIDAYLEFEIAPIAGMGFGAFLGALFGAKLGLK
jgi:hypothetical protein